MADFLLVETHDPLDGRGCAQFVADAVALAKAGHKMCLLLVSDGAFGAVTAALPEVEEFLAAGGELWLDRFSLRQRGLVETGLVAAARQVDMDEVAKRLLEPNQRAVWH